MVAPFRLPPYLQHLAVFAALIAVVVATAIVIVVAEEKKRKRRQKENNEPMKIGFTTMGGNPHSYGLPLYRAHCRPQTST